MKKILKMGSAFIGIIVGAGFASGQEILQYFTSFGLLGIVGAIISTALFAYLGMTLTRLGSRMRTTSHKEVIYKISGRYLGIVVDYIIIFTLFGVGVVMIAGAGCQLESTVWFTAICWQSADGCSGFLDNYYSMSTKWLVLLAVSHHFLLFRSLVSRCIV